MHFDNRSYDNCRETDIYARICLNYDKVTGVSSHRALTGRATEILKSKSVRATDDVIDVIGTCVRQSQIVMKTNDSSFSTKSVSEFDYFFNTM